MWHFEKKSDLMHIYSFPGTLGLLDNRSGHIYGVPSILGPDVDLVECSFDAYLRFSRLFGLVWTADLMHILWYSQLSEP